MGFVVNVEPKARIDMKDFVDYIKKESISSAEKLKNEFEKGIDGIGILPFIYPTMKTPLGKKLGLRFCLVKKKFAIIYAVDENKKLVQIFRVKHTSSDIKKIKKNEIN